MPGLRYWKVLGRLGLIVGRVGLGTGPSWLGRVGKWAELTVKRKYDTDKTLVVYHVICAFW